VDTAITVTDQPPRKPLPPRSHASPELLHEPRRLPHRIRCPRCHQLIEQVPCTICLALAVAKWNRKRLPGWAE
jgi:hypothetical protein